MKFIDRVKRVLLERSQEDLKGIEQKITEMNRKYSEERENSNILKQESENVSREKSEVQKNIRNKKELANLEIIYEFVANYPRIEKIVEVFANSRLSYNYNSESYEEDGNKIVDANELIHRHELYDLLKGINKQIIEINNADIKEFNNDEEKQEDKPEVKKNIFSRIFGKKQSKEQSKKEDNLFNKYRKTIFEYREFYNKFDHYFQNEFGVDKTTVTKIIYDINYLLSIRKKGIELDEKDEEYLMIMEPIELWSEILKFYSNSSLISSIVQNFANRIEEYERQHTENPNLLDLEELEAIFKENNEMIIELRSKNKAATSKNNEFIKRRQDENEIRAQIKALEGKRKDLIEKIRKINEARTLKELGYKNKSDAIQKLNIDSKDYIVIPIGKEIENISDLFNEEKEIRVEIDGNIYLTGYSNDVASGKINTIEGFENVDSALMVPIHLLKKEDIDHIRNGKIGINKSVLQFENLLIFLPEGRKFNTQDVKIEVRRYSRGEINTHLEEFFGEDYATGLSEIENYDVFKGSPNISGKEKKYKREAVKNCLFENLRRTVSQKEMILVDGKAYFLNQEDEKELYSRPNFEPLNEKKLIQIANEIENYLICDENGRQGFKIDQLYEKVLLEYMRVNKKAKAEYQEEDDTIINVKGKNISIKPILPSKDELIAKKYSRPTEDVIYKTMKLANLVNKFAHLSESKELQDALYSAKLDLIERVIDLAENNPKIKVRRDFDEDKMATSVILEIPGYNMIALHILNRNVSLSQKSQKLEKKQTETLQTSAILMPGVNRELLLALKNMSIEERIQTLLDLDSNTFYKLVLRMGYNLENIQNENDKKSFIQKMISDQKIAELLEQKEDLEKMNSRGR